jgi:hypothetical protein
MGRLISGARAGQGQVLVLRGEAVGSAWSRYAPVAARLELVVFDDDEHRLAGGAHHRDEVAERLLASE